MMMPLREEGYWDDHYELELRNFEQDGDEGEVWFGKGLNRRIADWLVAKLSLRIAEDKSSKVIDVGCGNAFMLITLLEKLKTKFDANQLAETLQALGVDYSINSINLSRRIIGKRTLEDLIRLEQCDFLELTQVKRLCLPGNEKFDVIIDKGTLDAICLLAVNNEVKLEGTKLKYMESLYSLVKIGSIFILASCNHTKDELLQIFVPDCQGKLDVKLLDEIETPKIQFGGKEGSQVTCLIFEFI